MDAVAKHDRGQEVVAKDLVKAIPAGRDGRISFPLTSPSAGDPSHRNGRIL